MIITIHYFTFDSKFLHNLFVLMNFPFVIAITHAQEMPVISTPAVKYTEGAVQGGQHQR
jgi:hypothetical protein